jgi:transposase
VGGRPPDAAQLAGRPGRDRPEPRQPGQHQRSGQKRGEATGPNPVDRGKRGSKYHLLVDRQGIPLAAKLSAANVHDSKLLEPLVGAIPPIRRPLGQPGRPRFRPRKLHGDKGYDYPSHRRALRRRGITPRIARRGVESGERLGRYRWVVERSIAWLLAHRRLATRYDRQALTVLGLLHLACALICVRFLRQAESAAAGA